VGIPAHELASQLVDLAIAIQQIPSPTFAEAERAAFVARQFGQAGLRDVATDELHNVYGRLPGGTGKAVLVSAHLDTVFPAGTDLAITRSEGRVAGPGIADNSLAVAALCLLPRALTGAALPGDLWIVANAREEGNGDLGGMRTVMKRLRTTVAGVVVLEGSGLGRVCHQGVGSRRYRVSVSAPGGHSWENFGQASAVHELVRLAGQMLTLEVRRSPKSTYNIGVISGGRSVNTIAESASLELDLRSESREGLESLVEQVERMVAGAGAPEVRVTLETIGDRTPGAIDTRHPLPELCRTVLRELRVEPRSRPESTDANVPLAMGIPAVCIGLTKAGDVHRASEYMETGPVATGLAQLVTLIPRVYGAL